MKTKKSIHHLVLGLSFCALVALTSCSSKSQKETTDSTRPPVSKAEIDKLLQKNTCFACHKEAERVVGPSYRDIAKRGYTNERIVALIYKPEPENWPEYPAPMIPLPHLDKEELLDIAQWINSLAVN